MKTNSVVVHAFLECQDCGAQWGNYLTAEQEAHAHAKARRHFVSGDIGHNVHYDGRLERSIEPRIRQAMKEEP